MSSLEIARRPNGMTARAAAILSAARTACLGSVARLAERRRARRNLRILGQLPDRELKDIGLTRSDLQRLVRLHPIG